MPTFDLASQLGPTRRIALRTGLPALALLSLIRVLGAHFDLDVTVLVRDPASLGHIPSYYGAISDLGVLLWFAAAAICLFTGLFVATSPTRSFLIGAAALSALLGADDLFMLHENAYRVLGIPQKLTYLGYVTLAAVWLVRFRAYVLAGDWGPLVLALGLLGTSVALDVVLTYLPIEQRGATYYEDGAKLVGIALWLGYFWNECRRALTRAAM